MMFHYLNMLPSSRRPVTIEDHVRRRAGHVLVQYKGLLFLWGGYMELPYSYQYNLMTTSLIEYYKAEEIWVYQPLIDTWTLKKSSGIVPLPLCGSCAAVHKEYMYVFGGFNQSMISGTTNGLWRLNLDTLLWESLNPTDSPPIPCDKSTCWIYGNRFYIFGGFGHAQVPYDPNIKVDISVDDTLSFARAWNNQLVYYDIDKSKWVWPKFKGRPPSPRAAHTASVSKNTVYVFGGRHRTSRMNDLYTLKLPEHVWSSNLNADCQPEEIPEGRSWHTFTFVSEDRAVLYGGFNATQQVLSDVWLFNTLSMTWTPHPTPLSPRLWHTSMFLESGVFAAFCGIRNNILDMSTFKEHAEDFVFITVNPRSLFNLCVDAVVQWRDKISWEGAPKVLQEILNARCCPSRIHCALKMGS